MNYLSVLDSLTKLLNNEATRTNTKQTLIKMFLLECRSNQKLLAIASWKTISAGIRNEALKSLNCDNAKSFYALSDKSILGELLGKVKLKNSNETNVEKASDTNLIISMITRVEALRFLGSLPNELQTESKARLSVRISNLNKVIIEVMEILEEQLID